MEHSVLVARNYRDAVKQLVSAAGVVHALYLQTSDAELRKLYDDLIARSYSLEQKANAWCGGPAGSPADLEACGLAGPDGN